MTDLAQKLEEAADGEGEAEEPHRAVRIVRHDQPGSRPERVTGVGPVVSSLRKGPSGGWWFPWDAPPSLRREPMRPNFKAQWGFGFVV